MRGRHWRVGMDRGKRVEKIADLPPRPKGEGMVGAWRYRKSAKRSTFQLAQLARDNRAAEARVDQLIYGDLLPEVMLLRRRDYIVTCERHGIKVGNRLLDADGVKAMADRERRLMGHP
jgi:hypothetical protein